MGYPIFSVIADDDIWVEAYFKETELSKIKIGQTATINIDSMPDYKLYAKVQGITKATGSEFSILPAQNSSGNWVKVTQRIMVRLELINNHLPVDIRPAMASGMSVTVKIDTNTNGGFKG
jgi:membrane fusion protein (multidrug efflux system)